MKKQGSYQSTRVYGILVALCIWMLPSVSVAQNYYDPGLLRKTVQRFPVEFISPGVRVGSFILNPGAELTWENNDNIYYISGDNIRKVGDNILHIRPWLDLRSDWNRH